MSIDDLRMEPRSFLLGAGVVDDDAMTLLGESPDEFRAYPSRRTGYQKNLLVGY